MLVDIISDIHLDSWQRHFYKKALDVSKFIKPNEGSKLCIFAGDAGNGPDYYRATCKFLSEVYTRGVIATPGNHDFYEEDNTTPLQDREGKSVVFVDGIKFVCSTLWTNFRNDLSSMLLASQCISDFKEIQWANINSIQELNANCLKYLEDESDNADVFVTHFCPFLGCEHEAYSDRSFLNPYFVNDLSDWFSKLSNKPKLWIHGHTHKKIDFTEQGTRVIANPIGYLNEEQRMPEFIPLQIDLREI